MADEIAQRILITRLSHIGDCILTLPMLTAIRKKHPGAFIGWAVESPAHHLLNLHPDIDEVINIPKRWMANPANWFSIGNQLKKYQFDIAIDPQGITKSAMLGRISGAKTRIGIKGRWGRELSPFLNNSLIKTNTPHIVDRSLELLQPLGVKKAEAEFRLPVCSAGKQKATQFINANALSKKFIVINPGGTWASKRWEMERFAAVASKLHQKTKIKSVVVWAGNDEREMAEQIVNASAGGAMLAEPTNLPELAALSNQALFFIGGDTGPLHIASAMGTPCIGLYGSTRHSESGAYGSQHIAIQRRYHEGSCRERRKANNDAMKAITVADVLSACKKMLRRINREQSRSA